VLESVAGLAKQENLNPEEIAKIYQRIFAASKDVQGVTVAFQGEPALIANRRPTSISVLLFAPGPAKVWKKSSTLWQNGKSNTV
jgi:hypothetical protein